MPELKICIHFTREMYIIKSAHFTLYIEIIIHFFNMKINYELIIGNGENLSRATERLI